MCPTGCIPLINLHLWGFLCVRNAARIGKKYKDQNDIYVDTVQCGGKRCSHVVVECEAGSVKSKIYGEPVDNCLENPLVPSLK